MLDYGCGPANILYQSQGVINPRNYTGFDVQKNLIDRNKLMWPESRFIHQDLHNPAYNSTGKETLSLDDTYDLIISYSVFTHTSYEEFDASINQLKEHLNPGGEMYLTFLSLNNTIVLSRLRDKALAQYGYVDEIYEVCDVCYLANGRIVDDVPNSVGLFLTLYNPSVLTSHGEILYNQYQNVLKVVK